MTTPVSAEVLAHALRPQLAAGNPIALRWAQRLDQAADPDAEARAIRAEVQEWVAEAQRLWDGLPEGVRAALARLAAERN